MERQVRVGVGAIVRDGSRLLLVRRRGVHGSGTWSTPGGHLDFGESPAECAAREALEETGAVVSTPVFRALTNDVVDDERHYLTVWMEAEYVGGEVVPRAAYELSEVGWFERDALPEPLFEPFRRLLEGDVV